LSLGQLVIIIFHCLFYSFCYILISDDFDRNTTGQLCTGWAQKVTLLPAMRQHSLQNPRYLYCLNNFNVCY